MHITKLSFILFSLILCTCHTCQGVTKKYISPQDLLEDSFSLAKAVFDSGFRPTYLIALWRGGAPIGIAVEEYFSYKKAPIPKHLSVRVSAYDNETKKSQVTVFNLDYVIKTMTYRDDVLIVDDVVDSGDSVEALVNEIKQKCGRNAPRHIRIATIYRKPHAKFTPHYCLYNTTDWLVFPHELVGLTPGEISQSKGRKVENTLEEKKPQDVRKVR